MVFLCFHTSTSSFIDKCTLSIQYNMIIKLKHGILEWTLVWAYFESFAVLWLYSFPFPTPPWLSLPLYPPTFMSFFSKKKKKIQNTMSQDNSKKKKLTKRKSIVQNNTKRKRTCNTQGACFLLACYSCALELPCIWSIGQCEISFPVGTRVCLFSLLIPSARILSAFSLCRSLG